MDKDVQLIVVNNVTNSVVGEPSSCWDVVVAMICVPTRPCPGCGGRMGAYHGGSTMRGECGDTWPGEDSPWKEPLEDTPTWLWGDRWLTRSGLMWLTWGLARAAVNRASCDSNRPEIAGQGNLWSSKVPGNHQVGDWTLH